MPEKLSRQRIADGLLEYLQRAIERPELSYAEEPRRTKGGGAPMYAFRLNGAPEPLDAPLTLRVYQRLSYPARPARERALHAALAAQGIAAPQGLLAEPGAWVGKHPFLILERVEGDLMEQRMSRIGTVLRAPGLFAELLAELHELGADAFLEALPEGDVPAYSITAAHQLERVGARVEDWQRPALQWLVEHFPPEPEQLSICHGEMRPESVLLEDGRVSWLIEWGNTKVADPAFDVGHTMFELLHQPTLPPYLRPIAPLVRQRMRSRFYASYRRRRDVDDAAVGYYEAFRLFREMADHPKKAGPLVPEFQRMTGVALEFPARKQQRPG